MISTTTMALAKMEMKLIDCCLLESKINFIMFCYFDVDANENEIDRLFCKHTLANDKCVLLELSCFYTFATAICKNSLKL